MRRHLVLIALVACSSDKRDDEVVPPPKPPRGTFVADSTIAARDYIGPAACAECHADEHARWSTSLHAVMNQRASTSAAVIGNFNGVTVEYAGGTARFAREAGDLTMTFAKAGRSVRYRVRRTIGFRGLQEYVGVEDGGSGDEVRLPFGWWPRRGGWYPQPYFDPWLTEQQFDAYAPVREPWATRCPWCHSTYPFAQRIGRSVGHGFEEFYEPPKSAPTIDKLDVTQQVTVGISCESCHLGGRAHAGGAPIHFVPIGAVARPEAPAATTFTKERADRAIANRVCAQCHSGPSPRLPDGTATRNSSEALDLAASDCAARCVDCHDPHRADARGDSARALAACTRCHADRSGRGHTGHDTASCLDCHMPRVVMGIDRYVRTHRISSPTDREMLAAAAPNACNVCHLDRTIQWTLDELRAGYEARIELGRTNAYGDDSVGEVWLASKEPAIRLVAAAAYARGPLGRSALPDIAKLLDDPLPYVRTWAVFAVEDILGRKLRDDEFDPRLPADARRKQLAKLKLHAVK